MRVPSLTGGLLSLTGGLLVALGLAILLALSVGVASVLTLRSVTHEQGLALVREASTLESVQVLLVLSERRARHARSWLLSPEPHVREELEVTRHEWELRLRQLEESFTGEEERALLARIRERQHAIQAIMDRLLAQGGQEVRKEDWRARFEAELRPLRVGLDQELSRLVALQQESLQEAVRQQERTRLRAVTRLGVAMLGAVLAAGACGALLVRSLRQHQRAEARVQRSEARFRATFNQAAVGLAQVSMDGRWVLLNPRFRDILGHGERELLGQRFADFTHPEDRARDEAHVRRLLAGELSSFTYEKRYLHPGGAVVWVNLSASLVRDDAGRPLYMLAAIEDITRRKALEDERVLLLAEAREALRLREEFLSVASHELRTPLTPLSLNLQMVLREARVHPEQSFARRVAQRLESGHQQVQRMTRLIEDLLDASRWGTDRLVLSLEDVDLSALVREVARRFEPVARRTGSALEVDAPAPVVGRWDAHRLEQVVASLLSNALKFGAGRPVLLRVEAEDGLARLTVRDEGIGIAPELLPHIFERFSRGVSDRHYGGMGLGLFLTRYVARSLGGEVVAESTPGQGATFIVRIPLRPVEGRGALASRDEASVPPV
ncbi:MAG TPA: ATP-binding protein [Archangium sp.]|uniref:sensor histidine kinase n=1 Tax=Archangium sp. TaxID=1872627 RepID=UPI002E3653F8|nr:ATP-binding protein [Archangium sp.]HEX5754094.1 ATP-binding protein [Archangium sp.]